MPTDPTPAQTPADPSPSSRSWLRNQRDNVLTIVMAVILALGIRAYVAEARWIPSSSMEPTLLIGDRLVVEKISYHFHPPERGDIIVFNPPEKLKFPEAFIKRVIGLPGDRISIRDGKVSVNGIPLAEPYIAEPPAYDCPSSDCFVADGSEFLVPAKSYFMMGDNRNNSQDSHVWGFLPEENIIGHTLFRFWPLNRLYYFSGVTYPPSGSDPGTN